MNNAINMLPCPMCGCSSINVKNEQPTDNSGGYFIECPDCGISTSLRYACGDDPIPLLAEQWNRRATAQCLHQIAEPATTESVLIEGTAYVVHAEVAAELLRLHIELQTAPQAVQPAVPVLFVSREQLESHTDHLASEAGRYLPARKTAVGKFTMPLYAHPAEEVPAPEMNEDGYLPCPFCGSHRVSLSTGQTGDGTPWHYVECESCAGTAEPEKWNERATQPAAQGLDAPNEWEGIHTMPTCDDLIWLYCQDTNTIDGPIAPDPSLEQYGWTHWAYANAPSTAGIDAAQAKQGGA